MDEYTCTPLYVYMFVFLLCFFSALVNLLLQDWQNLTPGITWLSCWVLSCICFMLLLSLFCSSEAGRAIIWVIVVCGAVTVWCNTCFLVTTITNKK
mgnify:CR=1 FL=1